MDELVSRQAVIDAVRAALLSWSYMPEWRDNKIIEAVEQLPPSQPEISYIISETLHECRIYGEEATVKLIGTLKRLGRDDLLPPCIR